MKSFSYLLFKYTITSIPIAVIVIFFAIFVLLVQAQNALSFLDDNPLIVKILSVAGVEQLFPILAAGAYVSKIGSKITAEISYMKITNQLDVIDSMGLNYYTIIVYPRLIACFCGYLLISIFSIFIGLISIYICGVFKLGFNEGTMLYYMFSSISTKNWFMSFAQINMFGFIICFFIKKESLKVNRNPKEVGWATKMSVVKTMIYGAFLSLLIKIFYVI